MNKCNIYYDSCKSTEKLSLIYQDTCEYAVKEIRNPTNLGFENSAILCGLKYSKFVDLSVDKRSNRPVSIEQMDIEYDERDGIARGVEARQGL